MTETITTLPAGRNAVRELDDCALHQLNNWVSDELEQRATGHISAVVRGVWEDDEHAPWSVDAVAVRFPADSWDDGWFYSHTNAVVVHADGSEHDYDFDGTEVEDVLNELSHVGRAVHGLDRHSVLTVDLRTGAVEHDKAYPTR